MSVVIPKCNTNLEQVVTTSKRSLNNVSSVTYIAISVILFELIQLIQN